MWQSGLILLYFVLLTIATNSTLPAIPTPSASPASHDDCVKHCLEALLVASRHSDFYDCMRSCLGTWPIRYVGKCPPFAKVDPNGPDTCIPTDTKASEIFWVNPRTNETVGFLYVSWSPCPAGIQDVTGFRTSVQRVEAASYPDCHHLELTRKLTTKDIGIRFGIYSLPQVVNSMQYHIQLQSLPLASRDKADRFTVDTIPCEELNPNDVQCFCTPPLDAPQVTVSGYRVVVTVFTIPRCHRIKRYDFVISPTRSRKVLFRGYRRVEGHEKEVPITFDKVYDSATVLTAHVSVRAFDNVWSTHRRAFSVEAWAPPAPNVTVHSHSHVEVSFPPAPENFSVSVYSLRLSRHLRPSNTTPPDSASSGNETKSIKIVSISDFDVNLIKHGVMTKKFVHLEPGTYSVQVREVRPESKYFNSAKWGKRQFFVVPSPPTTISVIFVPVAISVVIIAVVVLLVLWKSNSCQRIRYAIPPRLVNLLDTQAVTTMTKSVLLVWQADFRSMKLFKLHAEVVRQLTAYLRSACGLDVTVDLFCETDVNRSVSEWTRNALQKCDFVVFLCPHFDYSSSHEVVPSVYGNFQFIFSYLERDLVRGEKFVTALLPYSDSSLPSSEVLVRMSRVFTLMDDISGLYFHIKGVPQADLSGTRNAQFINAKDYKKSHAGAALERCIILFQQALSSWTQDPSSFDSLDVDEEVPSGESSMSLSSDGNDKSLIGDDSLKMNRMNVAPLPKENNGSPGNEDAAPLMVRSLRGVSSPPSPNSSMSRQIQHIHPPSPFVSDPDLAIRQINSSHLKIDPLRKTKAPSFSYQPLSVEEDTKKEADLPCSPCDQNIGTQDLNSSQSPSIPNLEDEEGSNNSSRKSDSQPPTLKKNQAANLHANKPPSEDCDAPIADSGFDSLVV